MAANGDITWCLPAVSPQGSGTVDLVAVAEGENGSQVKASFETEAEAVRKSTELSTHIVPDGSVTIINKLTGTGKSQSDAFTYHVRLTDPAGKLLAGYQAFSGSAEGRIKGEGDISLTGDGFLTFAGLPYGTVYEIIQKENERYLIFLVWRAN